VYGIFGVLDTALSSLRASQFALLITSNNIANAQNPDYVRRIPVFTERTPLLSLPLSIGRGVDVSAVERIKDNFLLAQWNSSLAALGENETREKILSRIEEIFNDLAGEGLSNALDQFWDAWEELSLDPTSAVAREDLLAKAQSLTLIFHDKAQRLNQLRKDTDKEIKALVDDVNQIAQQIANLNAEIKSLESKGTNSNTLRDEREKLVRKLSEKIGIEVFEDKGSLQVLVGGMPLVEDNRAFTLSTEVGSDGFSRMIWNNEGVAIDIADRIPTGEMRGYLNARDEEIPEYLSRLDLLAYNISVAVNALHQGGYGLDGSTGLNFFSPLSGVEGAALMIEVNPELIEDPQKIAAALENEPGNNENALRISELRDDTSYMPGGATFSQYYTNTVGLIGSDLSSAKAILENRQLVNKEIQDSFQAISGVSLDEEAANLMKYQYMYTASAKLFTVADEMLKTLINLGA